MSTHKPVKDILNDYKRTLQELRKIGILRDEKSYSIKNENSKQVYISFSGKNDKNNVVYDKHINYAEMMDILLIHQQYNILFYDKAFIQAEFIIEDTDIIKERLVFMKKHNKIWNREEIDEFESNDEDWFTEQDGVPIIIRIDYAPLDHIDCEHPAAHITLSNHESCRIPVKSVVTFSEFVRFILLHFYDIKLESNINHFNMEDTITESEKKMMHINWK